MKIAQYLRIAFILICVLYVISSSLFKIVDTDIWWHLKFGQWIWENQVLPKGDPFGSFVAANTNFPDVYWLFQLSCYALHALGGPNALILAKALILCATTLFLCWWLFLSEISNLKFSKSSASASYLALTLMLLVFQERFYERPEILSYFFLVIDFYLLWDFMNQGKDRLWLMALIQILWVNIHGFFVFGPILAFLSLVASLGHLPNFFKLLKLNAILFGACFLNPHGYHIFQVPLDQFEHIRAGGDILKEIILEFKNPWTATNSITMLAYKTLFIASLASWILNRQITKQLPFLFIHLFFAYFSTLAIRNIAPFALIAGPILVWNLNHWPALPMSLRASGEAISLKKSINNLLQALNMLIPLAAALFLFWQAYGFVTNKTYQSHHLPKRFGLGVATWHIPVHAIEFIQRHQIQGAFFHDFNAGGYFLWKLYPSKRPVIYPQIEAMGAQATINYFKTVSDFSQWKIWASSQKIQGIVFSHTLDFGLDFLTQLKNDPNWGIVWLDGCAFIALRKNSPDLTSLKKIARQELAPLISREHPQEAAYRGQALQILEQWNEAELALQKALQAEPKLAQVWANLGYTQDQLGKKEETEFSYRRAIDLKSNHAGIYNNFGDFLRRQGRPQEALAYFQRALKLAPNSPVILKNIKHTQSDINRNF